MAGSQRGRNGGGGRGPGPEQRVKRTTTVKPESGNAKEEEVKRLRAGRRRHGAGRRGASRGPGDGAAPGGPPAGARRRRRRRPGPKIPARYGIPPSSESTGGGGLPHEPRFLLPVHRQAYTRLHVFLSVYSAHLPPFFGVAKHRLPFFCQMQFPAEEKKQRRRWERERGSAEQGRQGRSVRVHLPKCHYQYYTSNQGENNIPAQQRRTAGAHYFALLRHARAAGAVEPALAGPAALARPQVAAHVHVGRLVRLAGQAGRLSDDVGRAGRGDAAPALLGLARTFPLAPGGLVAQPPPHHAASRPEAKSRGQSPGGSPERGWRAPRLKSR